MSNEDKAFPMYGVSSAVQHGMELRDYFAAKAMPNLIAMCQDGDGEWDPDTVAQNAYWLADAMMRQR